MDQNNNNTVSTPIDEWADQQKPNTLSTRAEMWRAALDAELQSLVQEASHIRQQMLSAKTATKKQYFGKKFKKVQSDVMTTLVALERVRQRTDTSSEVLPVEGGGDATCNQPTTA